ELAPFLAQLFVEYSTEYYPIFQQQPAGTRRPVHDSLSKIQTPRTLKKSNRLSGTNHLRLPSVAFDCKHIPSFQIVAILEPTIIRAETNHMVCALRVLSARSIGGNDRAKRRE